MANEENKAAQDTAAQDKERANIEAKNTELSEKAGMVTPADAAAYGYVGTTLSPFPNELHEAGSEEMRAEVFGSSPAPEAKAKERSGATLETAKAAVRLSNDLATVRNHPTLRGTEVVNGPSADVAKDKDK